MSNLKNQTISGIVWSAIQKIGTMGISFISNIVLARLLSPDDYGCIGLLAIFIVIAEVFVNGGFASALIQKQEPNKEDYSTVFFWNIFISCIFYIILFISAPFIASFYKIPLLASVLRVQGIILFIHAFSIVQLNILRKQLEFKKMSIIQVIAATISVVFAIILAYKSLGVWALVVQQILNALIVAIVLWITSQWKPSLCFSLKSFKELFAYGSFLLLSDLLNSVYDNIQSLIIGRKYSSSDMGFYTQARKLETIPTQSISYVVGLVTFPVYAKLQDQKNQLYVAVKKSLSSMNFLNFPLMILLIVIAKPLFILLFSDKWIDSVPYFQILCLSGLANCLQSVNYQVVCAVGRSKDIFKWNILKRIVGLLFILVGMNWGIHGMLYGMVVGVYFTYAVNALVATSTTGYTLFQQIKDFIPILVIAILAAFITYVVGCFIEWNYIVLLSIQVLVYIFSYLLIAKLTRRQELEEYTIIIKSYFSKECYDRC